MQRRWHAANIAMSKAGEEAVNRASEATDGSITDYTDGRRFAEFLWWGVSIVDVENVFDLRCIKLSLWN